MSVRGPGIPEGRAVAVACVSGVLPYGPETFAVFVDAIEP